MGWFDRDSIASAAEGFAGSIPVLGSALAPVVGGSLHTDDYFKNGDAALDQLGAAQYAVPAASYHGDHAVHDLENGDVPGAVGQGLDMGAELTEEMLLEGILA